MTLNALIEALDQADSTLPLSFIAEGVAIHGGYHVTELKQSDIRSMTCGGAFDAWSEARLQLMDGHGLSDPMPVGQFRLILGKVLKAFPDMAALPVSVEFAPSKEGLRLYRLGKAQVTEASVLLPLEPDRAVCKAAAPEKRSTCCA